MAKFSQEFLRQMATPAYGQGLFTAAQQAAQLPGQLRQQQQMKQQRQQLAQIDTNSPEGLLQQAQQYRKQGKITEALNAEKMAWALVTYHSNSFWRLLSLHSSWQRCNNRHSYKALVCSVKLLCQDLRLSWLQSKHGLICWVKQVLVFCQVL